MCGLVGVINKNKFGFLREQQEIFATLLFVDMLRGADSTGMFVVRGEGDVYVAKDAVHSVDFMSTDEYDEGQRRAFRDGMAMIGHNRKATKGNVVDRNAHPFNVENNIILVHNGTMSEDHTKHADVEVDSHAIAHLIHEKKNVTEALSSFWGAYALIWYDVAEATVSMIRNSQRPLWWMETQSSWIWASTPDMLEFARYRHGLRLITQPTELPEDVLQQYKLLPNKDWEVSNEKLSIRRTYTSNYPAGGYWNSTPSGAGGRRDRFLHESIPDEYEEYVRQEWSDQVIRQDTVPTQQRSANNTIVQLLPSPEATSERMYANAEPPEFAGLHERERLLAAESNNIIPYGEWMERVVKKYKWGDKIHCAPFDYTYVNGVDPSDGFYLYAVSLDSDCVMLRQFFSRDAATEERILQIASGGYIYEYTIGRKGWAPLKNGGDGNYRSDHPGYVVITSVNCKMLSRPQTNTVH